MKSDARWMTVLAWRVVVNTVVGTLVTAIIGELCVGFAGIFIVWAFSISPDPFSDALAVKGFSFNAVAAALIFGIATFKSAPGDIIEPVRALLGRIVLGQIVGTLLVCSAFLAFELLKAQMQPLPIAKSIAYDAFMLEWFGPPIVACCAIAGALTKRPAPQSATLKAE